MDPNACVERIETALAAGDWEEVGEAIADLTGWLARGGFAPTRPLPVFVAPNRKIGNAEAVLRRLLPTTFRHHLDIAAKRLGWGEAEKTTALVMYLEVCSAGHVVPFPAGFAEFIARQE